ncbi:histidine kinase [Altererythrobacter buctensis]|uniref:histidine kinase n=1 Tax=Alteraurantiacibacter buctensis TaxID=1503981 RepID=A0A844Z281_9SPHN|nr:histidine kinase [Alteraurantiacibacter buctensis]
MISEGGSARSKVTRGRVQRWLVGNPRFTPVGIFLLVIMVTLLAIFAIERSESERNQALQSSRSAALASALERRANASAAYLRAGAALIAAQGGEVQADDFRRFVSELRLDGDSRGAEGIGWAKVVRPGGEAAFNTLLNASAIIPAVLNPARQPGQPFSVGVLYLQPDTDRSRRALGFDMYSEPVRRAAMDEAADQARPTASGAVVLAQEGDEERPGFLIYMPVFVMVDGRRQLSGFVYSPFNGQDFLSSALELEDAGSYLVNLYDGWGDGSQLLASTSPGVEPSGRVVRLQVNIANRPFRIEVGRSGSAALSRLSMATLIFGLLAASLLMLLVRMLTRQALEDEAALNWFEEQSAIRATLTRELNHRVKNTLANVLSIIALTRRRGGSLDEFADGLDGRIRALSATHDLLTMSDWGATPIRALIEAELNPYAFEAEHTVEMAGPDVELAPNDALSLGLAIHELATNAAKYGALSRPGGTVSVTWHRRSEELVEVAWQESGGPPVVRPDRRGFGTDLIERVVAQELKQPVKLEFLPEGLRCLLTIPVRRPTQFAIRAGKQPPAITTPAEGK